MTRSPLARRLAELENRSRGRARYVVTVPLEFFVRGDPEADEVQRRAIDEHRRRTGYQGAVILAPDRDALTEAEWLARYSPYGGRA